MGATVHRMTARRKEKGDDREEDDRKGQPISIKLRKEEVKRSKEKLASGDRIL